MAGGRGIGKSVNLWKSVRGAKRSWGHGTGPNLNRIGGGMPHGPWQRSSYPRPQQRALPPGRPDPNWRYGKRPRTTRESAPYSKTYSRSSAVDNASTMDEMKTRGKKMYGELRGWAKKHPYQAGGAGAMALGAFGYGTGTMPGMNALSQPNQKPGAYSRGGYGSSGTSGISPQSSGGYAG